MSDQARTASRASRGARIRVGGVVQGVGFRPFVWTLARQHGLCGWVLNDEEGVLISVEGEEVDAFVRRLSVDPPALARIDGINVETVTPSGARGFHVRPSLREDRAKTIIPTDSAPCATCLDDIFDPDNRRYRYPFTNCTNCGPRFTIASSLPYDRRRTSMAPFAMCSTCQAEYNNPEDRRFHAQPNACADCGPRLSRELAEIVAALRDGAIVALKGLGGYHLAVDARNESAVRRLRDRKRRDAKPFAIMVAGLADARAFAEISHAEATLLEDRARPIVICRRRRGSRLAAGVSQGLGTLGIILPYTPLHYLIFHEAAGRPRGAQWLGEPQRVAFVMTSANIGGEPLVASREEADRRLGDIADMVVHHDREIAARCDDSVVRIIDGGPAYLRRARGACPSPIKLPVKVPPTLAVGGGLKNAICVTRGDEAFLSQHIGDLDNAATYEFFNETIAHMTRLLDVEPTRVACDLHPDFLSTRYALNCGLPVVRVQHHQAHIAAVAAERGILGPLPGLALDGFGLGADGASSWGGELLIVEGPTMRRLGSLAPLAQPGGDRAAQEPWRMAFSALHALGRTEEALRRFEDHREAALLRAMLDAGVNAPLTSSAGRLFDAACGLLGVSSIAAFEGEAAMKLEGLVDRPVIMESGWRIAGDTIDFRPLLGALADASPRAGANVFHGTLAAGLAAFVQERLCAANVRTRRVAVSGGCLQNAVLAQLLGERLAERGYKMSPPRAAPANDGGLSLGQAWTAALTDLD